MHGISKFLLANDRKTTHTVRLVVVSTTATLTWTVVFCVTVLESPHDSKGIWSYSGRAQSPDHLSSTDCLQLSPPLGMRQFYTHKYLNCKDVNKDPILNELRNTHSCKHQAVFSVWTPILQLQNVNTATGNIFFYRTIENNRTTMFRNFPPLN